jgi:hypothetical protein
MLNVQGYSCTKCGHSVTQWKHSYYECSCTRVSIYADIPLPESWKAPRDAQEAAKE